MKRVFHVGGRLHNARLIEADSPEQAAEMFVRENIFSDGIHMPGSVEFVYVTEEDLLGGRVMPYYDTPFRVEVSLCVSAVRFRESLEEFEER